MQSTSIPREQATPSSIGTDRSNWNTPRESTPRHTNKYDSSIAYGRSYFHSTEELFIDVKFSSKRNEDNEEFRNEERKQKYMDAIEYALKNDNRFNTAARKAKEIYISNKVHKGDKPEKYFSGSMEKYDKDGINKIKSHTFHLYVQNEEDMVYSSCEISEHADFVTVQSLQENIKKQEELITKLRERLADANEREKDRQRERQREREERERERQERERERQRDREERDRERQRDREREREGDRKRSRR